MAIPSGYRRIDTFTFYEEYEDKNPAIVEANGNIIISEENKAVFKGEENSQYIAFKIPRFYDGVDLTKTSIRIHWANDNNMLDGGAYTGAINGICNQEEIIFGWKIEGAVTALEGEVTFQVEAIGSNEKAETYVKKSNYGKLLILPSFDTGSGIEKPTENWYNDFVANMQRMVNEAEMYASQATQKAEEAWTRTDDVTGKKYRLGIMNGVPYFEEVKSEPVIP